MISLQISQLLKVFRICPAVAFNCIYKTNRIFCNALVFFFQNFFFSFPSLAAILVSLWLLSLCLPLISCFLSYVAFGITKDRLSSFPLNERHQLFSTDLCSSGWCLLGFPIENLPSPNLPCSFSVIILSLMYISVVLITPWWVWVMDELQESSSVADGDTKSVCFCFPGLKVKRWWYRSNKHWSLSWHNLFLFHSSRKEKEVVPLFHWHSPRV